MENNRIRKRRVVFLGKGQVAFARGPKGQEEESASRVSTLDRLLAGEKPLPKICAEASDCAERCSVAESIQTIVQLLNELEIPVCACCCNPGGIKAFCVTCKDARSGKSQTYLEWSRGLYADCRHLDLMAGEIARKRQTSCEDEFRRLAPMWLEVPRFNKSLAQRFLSRIQEQGGIVTKETRERAIGLAKGYALFGIDVAAYGLSLLPDFPHIGLVIKTWRPLGSAYLVRIVTLKKDEHVPIVGVLSGLGDYEADEAAGVPQIPDEAVKRLMQKILNSRVAPVGAPIRGDASWEEQIRTNSELVGEGVRERGGVVWEAQVWSDTTTVDKKILDKVRIALDLGGRTATRRLIRHLRQPGEWDAFREELRRYVEEQGMPTYALDPATRQKRAILATKVLGDLHSALKETETGRTQKTLKAIDDLLQVIERHEYLIPVPETPPSQTIKEYLEYPTPEYVEALETPLILSGVKDYPEDFLEDILAYGYAEEYMKIHRRFFVERIMAATRDYKISLKERPGKKVWKKIIKFYLDNPGDEGLRKERKHVFRFLDFLMEPPLRNRIILDSLSDCAGVAVKVITLGFGNSNAVMARIQDIRRALYVTKRLGMWGKGYVRCLLRALIDTLRE